MNGREREGGREGGRGRGTGRDRDKRKRDCFHCDFTNYRDSEVLKYINITM